MIIQGVDIMGINYFTKEQIELLSSNKYVVNVSEKAITYSEEFKLIFLSEMNNGLTPKLIFEKYGFSYNVLGKKRVTNCANRWKKQSIREQGLSDTRKLYSGRPREKDLTQDEKIERLKHKILILEQENAYLKKIRLIEKAALRKAKQDKNMN